VPAVLILSLEAHVDPALVAAVGRLLGGGGGGTLNGLNYSCPQGGILSVGRVPGGGGLRGAISFPDSLILGHDLRFVYSMSKVRLIYF
jgi:hypothetical protein